MEQIPDDPIIRSIEQTGFPPWFSEDEEDEDDYYMDDDCK